MATTSSVSVKKSITGSGLVFAWCTSCSFVADRNERGFSSRTNSSSLDSNSSWITVSRQADLEGEFCYDKGKVNQNEFYGTVQRPEQPDDSSITDISCKYWSISLIVGLSYSKVSGCERRLIQHSWNELKVRPPSLLINN